MCICNLSSKYYKFIRLRRLLFASSEGEDSSLHGLCQVTTTLPAALGHYHDRDKLIHHATRSMRGVKKSLLKQMQAAARQDVRWDIERCSSSHKWMQTGQQSLNSAVECAEVSVRLVSSEYDALQVCFWGLGMAAAQHVHRLLNWRVIVNRRAVLSSRI